MPDPQCLQGEIVVIFAKDPGAGNAKSRIAATEGADEANRIYRELLQVSARTMRDFTHVVTHPDQAGELARCYPQAKALLSHRGDTLGDRVTDALCQIKSSGAESICAVGTDCPELNASDIARSFALLRDGHDVVVGPAQDGGYYLIAVRDPQNGVFEATMWSRPGLLRETIGLMRQKGLRYRLLEEKSDIDSIEDYRRWQARRQSSILPKTQPEAD